jgi:hypothetical protein
MILVKIIIIPPPSFKLSGIAGQIFKHYKFNAIAGFGHFFEIKKNKCKSTPQGLAFQFVF